jgi:alpha-1,2-mannosyltransferase
LLGTCLFFVFLLCANFSGQQITDNVSTFTAGWAVGQLGTLDISSAPDVKPWTVKVGSELHSDRAPGAIGWVAGFYAVLGDPAYPTIYPAGAAASAAAAGAIAVLFVVFNRITTRRRALQAALIAAFATATWTISADAVWPHGPDQLWLAILIFALSSRNYYVAGLAGAAALLTRPLTAIATAVSGVFLSVAHRSWIPVLKVGAASSLGLLGLLLYNRYAFDAWTITPGSYHAFVGQFAGQSDSYDPTNVPALAKNIAGALVSPARGIFVLSPFLLILIPGVPAAWRAAPSWVRAAAVGGLGYAAVHLWANNFAGGAGFYSYRYTIESLTLLSPMLLLCWTEWVAQGLWRRRLFMLAVVVSVSEHAAGALYITPSITRPFDSWKHFLFVEALQQATWTEWAFFVLATVVASLYPLAMRRQQRQTDPAPTYEARASVME